MGKKSNSEDCATHGGNRGDRTKYREKCQGEGVIKKMQELCVKICRITNARFKLYRLVVYWWFFEHELQRDLGRTTRKAEVISRERKTKERRRKTETDSKKRERRKRDKGRMIKRLWRETEMEGFK